MLPIIHQMADDDCYGLPIARSDFHHHRSTAGNTHQWRVWHEACCSQVEHPKPQITSPQGDGYWGWFDSKCL